MVGSGEGGSRMELGRCSKDWGSTAFVIDLKEKQEKMSTDRTWERVRRTWKDCPRGRHEEECW
jgi:hypothetical protein